MSPVPLEDLSDSDPGILLSFILSLFLRFIAERGASRLLEHVGQMDKIFKIPPPPGKTGGPSLRPLEENIPSPLAPISQPGSVYVYMLLSIGRGCHRNLEKLKVTEIPGVEMLLALFTEVYFCFSKQGFLEHRKLSDCEHACPFLYRGKGVRM